ncbi:MAG: hypothetical protein IAF38_21000 [Bacteroidia bacterium]|nr:hypothetical protein [Bacteroidia bacterium]
MRKVFLALLILTAVIAISSTVMQVFPANIFVRLLTIGDRFSTSIAFIFTWILLLLPVFIPLFIYNLFVYRNKVPATLSGLTGIVLRRERAIPDAFFPFTIELNGEVKDKIGNGRSVFIELQPGTHHIQMRSGSRYSIPKEIIVKQGQVNIYEASVNKAVARRIPIGKENFILVNRSF